MRQHYAGTHFISYKCVQAVYTGANRQGNYCKPQNAYNCILRWHKLLTSCLIRSYFIIKRSPSGLALYNVYVPIRHDVSNIYTCGGWGNTYRNVPVHAIGKRKAGSIASSKVANSSISATHTCFFFSTNCDGCGTTFSRPTEPCLMVVCIRMFISLPYVCTV